MKRIISAILLSFVLAFSLYKVGELFAWTGSNQYCEIVSPDAFNDNSTLNIPIKVTFKGKNSTNAPDYYKFYLVLETGTDTTISDTEWATKVPVFGMIEDINQDTPFVLGWLTSSQLISGRIYYLVGVGKDILGSTSCDTTKIGNDNMNGVGDAGASDSAIARFTVGGLRP